MKSRPAEAPSEFSPAVASSLTSETSPVLVNGGARLLLLDCPIDCIACGHAVEVADVDLLYCSNVYCVLYCHEFSI